MQENNNYFNKKMKPFKAINWNRIDDFIDKLTWDKLNSQFWLDTRIPVANDLKDWKKLTDEERLQYNRVFAGLTVLDTLQSENGVSSLMTDVLTPHEEAVMNNIQFMESVHAKSYSTIFSTFNSPSEIDAIFEWIETNEQLQYKIQTINYVYQNGSDLEKKAVSVLLESFLFYSGFYTPLKYLGESKMINVAEIIKLIIRDESVHGTYIGHKFRKGFEKLDKEEQNRLHSWVIDITFALWENEIKYTEFVYNGTSWTPLVKTFLEYNANKAFDNLGFPPLFTTTSADVDPIVMNGLATTTSNHDFFSQAGNGYLMGHVEPLNNDDYAMIYELSK